MFLENHLTVTVKEECFDCTLGRVTLLLPLLQFHLIKHFTLILFHLACIKNSMKNIFLEYRVLLEPLSFQTDQCGLDIIFNLLNSLLFLAIIQFNSIFCWFQSNLFFLFLKIISFPFRCYLFLELYFGNTVSDTKKPFFFQLHVFSVEGYCFVCDIFFLYWLICFSNETVLQKQ